MHLPIDQAPYIADSYTNFLSTSIWKLTSFISENQLENEINLIQYNRFRPVSDASESLRLHN